MTEVQRARLATVIDCEGYISIIRGSVRTGRRTPIYASRVGVSMVTPNFIRELKETFGGSVRFARRSANPNWRPQYSWQITDQMAADALIVLFPELRLKTKQAMAVIRLNTEREARRTKRTWGPGRGIDTTFYEALYQECRAENKRGN